MRRASRVASMPRRRLEALGPRVRRCAARLAARAGPRCAREYDGRADAARYLRGHRSAVDASAARAVARALALPRASSRSWPSADTAAASSIRTRTSTSCPAAATRSPAADAQASSASSACSGTSGSSSATACAPSDGMRRGGGEGRHGADRAARGAPPRGQPGARSRSSANALRDGFDPQAFFKAKRLEQEQRHDEVPGQPLQPRAQPQGSPGRPARPAGGPLGRPRRAASAATGARSPRAGSITPRGGAASSIATRTASRGLRIRLHLLAGRREDRILFDYQIALAEALRLRRDRREARRASCSCSATTAPRRR